MREIFTLDSAFARLDSIRSSKGETLHPLSRRASESALLLLRLLCTAPGPLPGPEIHRLAASWLSDPSLSVTDLPSWLPKKGVRYSLSPGRMDEARKGVRASLDGGLWIVALENPSNPGGDLPRCPQFLLGRGTLSPEDSWIVFFNSRKPRSISRKARWLRFLRDSLNRLPAFGYGLATSVGTLTYDLAAAFARSRNIPLLLCLPFAHGSSGPVNGLPSISPTLPCRAALSCLPATVVCPKAVRMQCRDRILAILADVRVLLEIRRQGTLLEMLSIEQRHRPRPQLVMLPDSPTPSNEGNLEILKDFPSWSLPISPGEP
ncbi:MAG: hypothetical protein KBH99_11235, partial [Syntrophobacteraceae bacterium]|nr:hypothetical protein [Syntrophobacteraceae bacterium]